MNQVATKNRVTFNVTGLGLTGAEWVTRLEADGHMIYDWARDILTKSDYDQNHRLEAGKEYKVTLVFGNEIGNNFERTTANLKEFACREIGDHSVEGLKGELALLIREKFSNDELKAMGIYYIAVLHVPIVGSDDRAGVLSPGRGDKGSCVSAFFDDFGFEWGRRSTFAFFVSA